MSVLLFVVIVFMITASLLPGGFYRFTGETHNTPFPFNMTVMQASTMICKL